MLIWLFALFTASVVVLLILTTRLGIHPFLALLVCAIGYGICAGMPYEWVLRSIRDGMSASFGSTGLLLLAGALVAVFLERSGGGRRLAEAAAGHYRKRRIAAFATIGGSFSGLGASSEAAFLLLAPVVRLLAGTNRRLAGGAQLSLGFAILSANAMVVPAPVAIMVKTIFDADVMQVLEYGVVAASAGAGAGLAFIALAARVHWPASEDAGVPARESAGAPEAAPHDGNQISVSGKSGCRCSALLPVVLPLVLLIVGSLGQLPGEPFGRGSADMLAPLGGPIVMLVAALLFALLLPARRAGRALLENKGWLGKAIEITAPTLMIAAAGTGFARVLQNSTLPDVVGEALLGVGFGGGLLLPFVFAAALRIAQGSVAVAMISASGFCEPLLSDLGLADGSGRAFAALAVGAGAIVGSHANDSMFWVVTRTIGLSPTAGYRLQTLGSSCVGVAAFLALLAMHSLFG